MTIASTTNRDDYTGNGAVSVYAYNFKIFSSSDLLVTQRDLSGVETTLLLTTDYTVSGVGDTTGGNVTLTAGNLTTGYLLAIRRVRPLTQNTDIRNQGDFFPETHEDKFDDLTMIAQQLENDLSRSLKLPETGTGISTSLPVPVALKWPRWNAAGTALENVNGGDLSNVTTFGDGLTLTNGDVSVDSPNRFGVAGGTVDVITAITNPVIISPTHNLVVIVNSLGANTVPTITFNPDGTGAKTIVKDNNTILLVGDIPSANYRMHLVFDASLDKWVLMNPGNLATQTGVQTLTNKTLTSPVINTPTITSPTIDAGITLNGNAWPSFRAELASGQSVAPNVATKVVFDSEIFDTNSNYDPVTNYRFSPTTHGKYLLHAQIVSGGLSANATIDINIYKNGVRIVTYAALSPTAGTTVSVSVSTIVDVVGADYFEVYVTHNDTVNNALQTSGHFSYFTACRIG